MARLGSCLCEQVRFSISDELRLVEYCHCRTCRRSVGAPVMAWVAVGKDCFELLGASPGRYESSPGVERTFCNRCGTSLTIAAETYPDEIYVSLSALADMDTIVPECHIWRSQRLPWFDTTDSLPRFLRFKYEGELE